MTKIKYPKISIVIPVYNEEDKIKRCLESIRSQDYPQENIEIVFVDDDSTDNTLKIAKKFKIKYVRNGKHDYDIGKSLGIKNSSNEYIMFLDADNILPCRDWFKRIVEPFQKNLDIVGAQPIWFTYDKDDPLVNRYATLFGITDPTTIYFKKRDRLMLIEKKWNLVRNYKETDTFFLINFNINNLPTIGSVGFITRKDYLLKTNYSPTFSHLDCVHDLVIQGYNKFAMVKLDIIHLHSTTIKDFLGKLRRNMNIYIRDYKQRRYTWKVSPFRFVFGTLVMLTFIIPFYHSIRGYLKIKDKAWFLHLYICFRVALMYSIFIIKWKIKDLLKAKF